MTDEEKKLKEDIRKEFLEYWVKTATEQEIVEKLIQSDDRAKEINKLNNVIDRMAEDIKQTNISLANEGYEMETFWLNIDEIKKHFMEENQNV